MSRLVPRSRCGSAIVAALVAGAIAAASGFAAAESAVRGPAAPEMVRIAAGRYRPLYRQPVRGADRDTLVRVVVPVDVPAFELARFPVTNAEYLAFVTAHPKWRRSQVSKLFADASYLRHWQGDLDPGPRAPARSPVVHVSWFAARAYAAALGCRLPTVSEWEYVAAADETHRDASRDATFLDRIRTFASRPTPDVLPPVGGRFRNVWGVDDMHGLVWEWTLDFNSALVSGESRGDASLERPLYCGSGASNAGDFADYAAFMRFAYRASLEASYTTANLGFRCARSPAPKGEASR